MIKCLLCNSKNNKVIFTYKGKDIYLEKLGVKNFKLKWYRCHNCGVYFSRQYENIENVYKDNTLYDAQYDRFSIKNRFKKIMELKKGESDNALRVIRIKRFHEKYLADFKIHKKIFNLLDVGAGLGVFLAKFLDKQYRGFALEINSVAAQHITEELNIPVYRKPLQALKANKKFDLITMNRVVEHIKKPKGILQTAKKRLSKNGLLYLELPDSVSYEFGGNTCDAFNSGHYMAYNPESVFFLLNLSGFEILSLNRIFEPSGKHTIYVFARSKG